MQQFTTIRNNISGFIIPAIAGVWIISQIFFVSHFGIVTNGEAEKYIREANQLLETGHYSAGKFLFYSTQILLTALSIKLQAGYWLIVLLQILLNGISVICFYKIVQQYAGKNWIAPAATVYFLLLFYYHQFNTYLYTESIFFSLSVIYTYVLFSVKKLNVKSSAGIFLFLTLLYFTRPTGIFFLPATFLYLVFKFYPQRAGRILLIWGIVGVLALILLLNIALGSGGEFDFMLPYVEGHVLCGVPTTEGGKEFEMPVNQNSVEGLFYFITHYPDVFIQLGAKRLYSFFGATRSFYSVFHNIFLAAYFYFAYLLIVLNLRSLARKMTASFLFLVTPVLFMAVTVMVSCDEWSNRFLLSVVPFILLLAAFSLSLKKSRIKKA